MNKIVDPKGFGFLITDLSRLIRAEFDRRIGETGLGLTAGEARALSHVARAGGSRQSVLAEKMGVEAMTLTGFLDRLEARGLVERTTDPSDRRAISNLRSFMLLTMTNRVRPLWLISRLVMKSGMTPTTSPPCSRAPSAMAPIMPMLAPPYTTRMP